MNNLAFRMLLKSGRPINNRKETAGKDTECRAGKLGYLYEEIPVNNITWTSVHKGGDGPIETHWWVRSKLVRKARGKSRLCRLSKTRRLTSAPQRKYGREGGDVRLWSWQRPCRAPGLSFSAGPWRTLCPLRFRQSSNIVAT